MHADTYTVHGKHKQEVLFIRLVKHLGSPTYYTVALLSMCTGADSKVGFQYVVPLDSSTPPG